MLHGLLVGSLAEWYFTAAPRLARRRTVVLYDLRGHGKSDRPPSGYDAATLAGDLAELVDAVPVATPLDLVGHSFGGLVALRFALHHPGLVGKLALVDVPLPPSLLPEMARLDASSAERLVESLPGPIRDAFAGGGRRARKIAGALRALTLETTLLDDLRREPDVPDAELRTLALPVLAIFGASSRCLPAGERIARAVPGARLEVLPGGHFLPLECPGYLADALETFLVG